MAQTAAVPAENKFMRMCIQYIFDRAANDAKMVNSAEAAGEEDELAVDTLDAVEGAE